MNDKSGPSSHPLVRAAVTEAHMSERVHFLDNNVRRTSACMSDLAGMANTGIGVHKASIAPGCSSTVVHTHLYESEWLFVLKGSAMLTLVKPTDDHSIHDLLPPREPENLVKEQHTLAPGDFVGFPAGAPAERWAHSLSAGSEGLLYLLGGTRMPIDVITYPEMGKTLVLQAEREAEAIFDKRAA